jgi:hypothetical protein
MTVVAAGVARRVVWGARKSELVGWDRPNPPRTLRHCVQSKLKEKEFAREPRWDVVAGTGEGHGEPDI